VDTEVLQAIWHENGSVPGTSGESICDIEILQLIEEWRQDE
jgi:hypothetical protein